MATRPTLHVAVEKTKNTASDYNDNFDMMMDFIDASIDEAKDYVDDFMPAISSSTKNKVLTNNGTTASWDVAVPVGTVINYGGSYAPSGWLVCDGSAISRTTYADLYSAIGTTFGEGDESTTFNLPDLIDRVAQGSTTVGTELDGAIPNIKGTFTGGTNYMNTQQSGAFVWNGNTGGVDPGNGRTYGNAQYNFDASRSSSVYSDEATTVQSPALTLLPIIKY